MENKPKGFKYLSGLNRNDFEILLKPYKSEQESNNEKKSNVLDVFSLSGSKAKQLVTDPYSRYKEVFMNEKNSYFDSEEAQIRMLMGRMQEDIIVYHLIKPRYENNPFWNDKVVVIDKRRRYVKDMPWISYELDLLVYQLEKPRTEYSDFDGYKKDFVINNTFGAYDDFLSQQIKYAVYDIKTSQVDIFENFDNYIYQLNFYAYFENVNRVGLFVLYKNAKLDELVQNTNIDKTNEIFIAYDNFIKKLDTTDNVLPNFDEEKEKGICTDLPLEIEDKNKQIILNNIYDALGLLPDYNNAYKKAETELKLLKDYIKLNLPIITNKTEYSINIPLSSDGSEKISFYTTKVSNKQEINTKELIKFLNNYDVKSIITKDGKEIDFPWQKFIYTKISGGTPMFRLTNKNSININPEILEKFEGEKYEF